MSEMKSIAYEDLNIGDTATLKKVITDEDIQKFAEVSLDTNPLHLDEAFAKTTMFGRRIAHGMISAGLISAAIGTQLPGVNTVYLGQELKFVAPVFIGDELTVEVKVAAKRDDKHIVTLETTVRNQDGKEVTTGQAVVLKK